jgi:hypothetical protein
MKKSENEGSKPLSTFSYKLLLGHLSDALLRTITDKEKKRQLTEYIKALAIALLRCCDLHMSQPKNDEQEKKLSLSVLNRRVKNKPEYLILELKKDPNKQEAIENPKFGEIIKLLSERFNIQPEFEQPNLRIVVASLGVMAIGNSTIGNLTEKDVFDIIIDALQSHKNILKEQIDVWLE